MAETSYQVSVSRQLITCQLSGPRLFVDATFDSNDHSSLCMAAHSKGLRTHTSFHTIWNGVSAVPHCIIYTTASIMKLFLEESQPHTRKHCAPLGSIRYSKNSSTGAQACSRRTHFLGFSQSEPSAGSPDSPSDAPHRHWHRRVSERQEPTPQSWRDQLVLDMNGKHIPKPSPPCTWSRSHCSIQV